MSKGTEWVIFFAVFGGILIGLGVFAWRSGSLTTNQGVKIVRGKYPVHAYVLGATINKTDINIATMAELEALPKIGKVTADKIIAGRPYRAILELVEKKIVTAKVYEAIKDLIDTGQ